MVPPKPIPAPLPSGWPRIADIYEGRSSDCISVVRAPFNRSPQNNRRVTKRALQIREYARACILYDMPLTSIKSETHRMFQGCPVEAWLAS